MMYVFFGKSRSHQHAHESPQVMTMPLKILAGCAILIGFLGTPAWPWLEGYINGNAGHGGLGRLFSGDFLGLAVLSTLVVGAGIATGWYLYSRVTEKDILETRFPELYNALSNRLWIDEAYDATVIRSNERIALSTARLERLFFSAVGWVTGLIAVGFGWIVRVFDQFVIDLGFDRTCHGLQTSADRARRLQHGRVQNYIQSIAVTITVLVLVLLMWGCKGS